MNDQDEYVIPPEVTLTKPAYGTPCNGCGICCMVQQCPISLMFFGEKPRCPAIVPSGPGFSCGMVLSPFSFIPESDNERADKLLGKAVAYVLGAGAGCDSEGPGENVTEADRERLREGVNYVVGRAAYMLIEAYADRG